MPGKPTHLANAGKVSVLGELILIVAIFYLASPTPPPGVNEPHYLCRLRHAADPAYCPGDLFLESPDAHYTVVWMFAWLTRVLPLSAVAWIGRLAVWTALAWAWRRLSWLVVPRPLFAALGAAIVVVGIAECNFAGEWMVGGFEAKSVAYVFVLLGLAAWIRNQWNWVWVHLGLASAWHALVGGWSVLILFGLWVFGWRREQSFSDMLPGLLIGGVLSLAGVVPALALSSSQPAEVRAEAAEIYVFERLPHHLAPLHKPSAWVVERAGRHAFAAGLFVLLLTVRRAELVYRGRRFRDDPAARIACYAVGAMTLAMVGLAIEVAFYDQPLRAAGWLRYYWFRLTDVAVPLAAALLWLRLLADLFEENRSLATGMLTVMLLLVGVPMAEDFRSFLSHPVAASDARMRNPDDWRDVCQYVEEHTPRDAMFLTPRGNTSFKWHAARAEVVTYKDVPQDAASLVEWRRRLYDVFKPDGDRTRDWVGSLCELGSARIRELSTEYDVDYVLTTRQQPLAFPILYDNDTYVVYDVDQDE